MTRTLSANLALLLFRVAGSERQPTRQVEYLLAWSGLIWSLAVLKPGRILAGAQYEYLLAIAPEVLWGMVGVMLGVLRLVALAINGAWRRTPGLRFIGGATGLIWWLVLAALYSLAVQKGAADFPMRHVLGVFIYYEAFSCYRCGQDHAAAVAAARRECRTGAEGG